MKVFSISFASSSFRRQQALQYRDLQLIGLEHRNIILMGPQDLKRIGFDNEFEWANEGNRYGWFSFKPLIILNALESMNNGDLLLYLDSNDRPKQGIIEYMLSKFQINPVLQILAPATNYINISMISDYHKRNIAKELLVGSSIRCQPEAGCVVVRNTIITRRLLRIWYELTSLNAIELKQTNSNSGRWDQETLYLMARMYRHIKIESWYRYKLTGKGIRKYIDFEYYRHL